MLSISNNKYTPFVCTTFQKFSQTNLSVSSKHSFYLQLELHYQCFFSVNKEIRPYFPQIDEAIITIIPVDTTLFFAIVWKVDMLTFL